MSTVNFFLAGTALILLHEMDAMRCREWKIFPGLSLLKESIAMPVFVLLHIPLFYWVLAEIESNSISFRNGFDVFLIIHMVLHILFLKHKENRFQDWMSWSIIILAAMCGAIDLMV